MRKDTTGGDSIIIHQLSELIVVSDGFLDVF